MDIEIAALCGAATEQAGKLSCWAPSTALPPQFPSCITFVAYHIRFSWRNRALANADGRSIMPPLESRMEIRVPGANLHY
jgi:hypothetical protein